MKKNCPECESKEFVTEPNQYDILDFKENEFKKVSTVRIDDYKIFCRECGSQVVQKGNEIIVKREIAL